MKRGNIAAALTLIGIGAWFLALEIVPTLKGFAYGAQTWPLPIIGIGLFLALIALLSWTPGLFVPASIVSGVGALLWWQNTTQNWDSWAYAWALIPGFVGIGMILAGILERNPGTLKAGGWMIFNSLILFAIFGSFLGGGEIVARYWPVLLILFGLMLLIQGVRRR